MYVCVFTWPCKSCLRQGHSIVPNSTTQDSQCFLKGHTPLGCKLLCNDCTGNGPSIKQLDIVAIARTSGMSDNSPGKWDHAVDAEADTI